jgi:hypothetical protein
MMAVVAKIGAARSALPPITAKERAFSRSMPFVKRRHATSCGITTCVTGSAVALRTSVHASSPLEMNHVPPASPEISNLTDVPAGAAAVGQTWGLAIAAFPDLYFLVPLNAVSTP